MGKGKEKEDLKKKAEQASEEAETVKAEEAQEAENAGPEAGEKAEEPAAAEEAEDTADADPAEEASGDEEETADEAKGFFKKKKEKEKKDKNAEKIDELTDKLQRQMAEFENYRKRTEKEKAAMYDMGTRDTIEKLLPVLDNFERGLAGAAEEDPFAEGMKMIYRQMITTLTDLGVTPIEAEGQEFDPNLHNAVMHVDDENFGENVVAEELQKGYMYKDHVVRHSMVKVAN